MSVTQFLSCGRTAYGLVGNQEDEMWWCDDHTELRSRVTQIFRLLLALTFVCVVPIFVVQKENMFAQYEPEARRYEY